MTKVMAVVFLLVVLAVAVGVRAEHNGSAPNDGSVDIDMKLGLKGFRLGARLFGSEGYAGGAWLNGETRSDGFSLDGRLERDGKAHNFKMNVDINEALKRAARWVGLTDL